MSALGVSGIILAAGQGRRMGGPKAMLEVHGRTLLERHVSRLLEAGCGWVTAALCPEVYREACARLRDLVHDGRLRLLSVRTSSQSESLAAVIAHAPRTSAMVVVTPVDLLPAELATHAALLRALRGDTIAATPHVRGVGGHPVLVLRSALAAYERFAPGPPPPLRDVLRSFGERRVRVAVDDRSVLGDFDLLTDLPRGAMPKAASSSAA